MFLKEIGFPVWTLFVIVGVLFYRGFTIPKFGWEFKNKNAAISLIFTIIAVQIIKQTGVENVEYFYFIATFFITAIVFLYFDVVFSGFIGGVSLSYLLNGLGYLSYDQSRLLLEALCLIGMFFCGKIGPDRGEYSLQSLLRLDLQQRSPSGGLSLLYSKLQQSDSPDGTRGKELKKDLDQDSGE